MTETDVPRPYRAAVCQVAVDIDDPGATRRAGAEALQAAVASGARLVVLPELLLSGYVFADAEEARSRAEPVHGPTLELLRSVSAPSPTVLVAGFCEQGPDGSVHSSAMVVQDGAVLAVHRKTHLWGEERRVLSAADQPPAVVATAVGRLGLAICYELEFPEWTRSLALLGAEVVAAPCNWPSHGPEGDQDPHESVLARAAAITNGVYVAVADRTGHERGTGWVGGSLVVDPTGRVLTPARPGEPALLTAEVDPARSRAKDRGEHNDLLADRRPELYPRWGTP